MFSHIILVGNIPEYGYGLCFAVGAPRRFFFLDKKCISRNSEVSFREKLNFWVRNLERFLIKVVHMDRTLQQGPSLVAVGYVFICLLDSNVSI